MTAWISVIFILNDNVPVCGQELPCLRFECLRVLFNGFFSWIFNINKCGGIHKERLWWDTTSDLVKSVRAKSANDEENRKGATATETCAMQTQRREREKKEASSAQGPHLQHQQIWEGN